MWSVGVVLLEMLDQEGPPFYGQSEIEQLLLIIKMRGTPNEETLERYSSYKQLIKIGARLPKFP